MSLKPCFPTCFLSALSSWRFVYALCSFYLSFLYHMTKQYILCTLFRNSFTLSPSSLFLIFEFSLAHSLAFSSTHKPAHYFLPLGLEYKRFPKITHNRAYPHHSHSKCAYPPNKNNTNAQKNNNQKLVSKISDLTWNYRT